jgi:hypothetical protein
LSQAVVAQRTITLGPFLDQDDVEEEQEDGQNENGTHQIVLLSRKCTHTTYIAHLINHRCNFVITIRSPVDQQSVVLDLMYNAAAEVLSLRRLTEFVDPPTTLRLQSSQGMRQQTGILVVNKLGDWGQFGLQPLKVAHQQEGDRVSSLACSTLKGGHFDGQIDIQIE